MLADEGNYQGLSRLNTDLVQHETARSSGRRVTLDIDSSESRVYGAQEESAYMATSSLSANHPLFVFNQDGDCLTAKLRPGNVHGAEGWDAILLPVIDRLKGRADRGRPRRRGLRRPGPL